MAGQLQGTYNTGTQRCKILPCWAAPGCHHWGVHEKTCSRHYWHSSLWCGTAYRGIHVALVKDKTENDPVNLILLHCLIVSIQRQSNKHISITSNYLVLIFFLCKAVKDIMHVRAVVSSGTKPSDVEFAQLLLLGQLNVMAEIAVIPLVRKKVIMKSVWRTEINSDQRGQNITKCQQSFILLQLTFVYFCDIKSTMVTLDFFFCLSFYLTALDA